MSLWTWFGLTAGTASTDWPLRGNADGQAGVLGMPRYDPDKCREDCDACAEACITHAISVDPAHGSGGSRLRVDYGRCIVCQLCTEACPTGAFSPSGDWAFAVHSREDLVWRDALASGPAQELAAGIQRVFRRSLHVRHVDSGSCNGCESELQALDNPFYNLHRLGVFFTPSPRFADLLLVTGPVTHAMHGPLLAAWNGMPEPRFVMAVGTCAVSGGVADGGYACGHGLDGVIPVDVYLPGCPPNPAALIHALLMLLGRMQPRVHGGQVGA